MSCDSIFNGDTIVHLLETCLSTVSSSEETSIFTQQFLKLNADISQCSMWIFCISFSQRGKCEFETQDFLFTKGTGQPLFDRLMLSLCSATSSAEDTTVKVISCDPLVRQLLELILGRNWIRHLAARTDITDFLLFSVLYSSCGLVDVQKDTGLKVVGYFLCFFTFKSNRVRQKLLSFICVNRKSTLSCFVFSLSCLMTLYSENHVSALLTSRSECVYNTEQHMQQNSMTAYEHLRATVQQ